MLLVKTVTGSPRLGVATGAWAVPLDGGVAKFCKSMCGVINTVLDIFQNDWGWIKVSVKEPALSVHGRLSSKSWVK